VGVVYGKGKSVGRAEIQAVLDEQRAVWQADFDKQVAETARVQAAWDSTKERERAANEKLAVATADGAGLSERLRIATRGRRCPVPAAAGVGTEPGAAGEVADLGAEIERLAGEIDRVTDEHFGNCASDAEQLSLIQKRYNDMRDAQ
jgi:hypothetical protein